LGPSPQAGCSPPNLRRELATAIARSLVTGKPSAVPFEYALEQLAIRYNLAPWELEEDLLSGRLDIRWLEQGLMFMEVEQSVRVTSERR
jgi:hypothetical protein